MRISARMFMRFSLLFFVLGVCSTLRAQEKYRLAVILPQSGPIASLGEYVKKGIMLAREEMSEAEKGRIELLFEDDQFDPKLTLSAYQRLSIRSPLDAVFVIGSPPANVLTPTTERQRQILVAIGGSDPAIVQGRRYSFIHWVIPEVLGKKLAAEMSRRNFKRIAFVTAEVTGALADRRGAVEALEALGMGERIVYDQTFEKGNTDYRAALNAIKAKEADALVLVLFPGALSAFTKQARDLGLKSEIVGVETFEDEAEVKAANGAMNGRWYVNASDPTDEFVALYKAKYGEHPGWASANAYDTMKLLAEALAAGKRSSDEVRDYLGALRDYHGACGTYSASGDNRFLLPAALKRVTEDGFKSIEKSD